MIVVKPCLILGAAPADAAPSTHVAAGAWALPASALHGDAVRDSFADIPSTAPFQSVVEGKEGTESCGTPSSGNDVERCGNTRERFAEGSAKGSAKGLSSLAVNSAPDDAPCTRAGSETGYETGGMLYRMPPEPLADPERLACAAAQAVRLASALAPQLRDHLNRQHGVDHDSRYWDCLLAPWLVRVLETLVDRLHRTAGLVETFGGEALRVPVLTGSLDHSPYSFANTEDFIRNGILDPVWNHWIVSCLLRRCWPESWEAVEQPAPQRNAPTAQPESRLKRVVRQMVFGLPFPRVKGFSLWDSLRLSWTLVRNRQQQDDTISLAEAAGVLEGMRGSQRADRSALAGVKASGRAEPAGDMAAGVQTSGGAESASGLDEASVPPLPLGFSDAEALAFVLGLLPVSLRTAVVPKRLDQAPCVRTRVVSVAACEDDAYRLRVAAQRGRGCRLVFIQHGGEYGTVRTSVAYPLVEYNQHRFCSWGWSRHGELGGNILPLPHPQLAALRGAHRETTATLLFVGTEMLLVPYTLKAMLRGRQHIAYRQDKARFVAALPATLQKQTAYRPYFTSPCALPDAPWVLARFPLVRQCCGALEPHLLGCRLLVLDHIGTTFAQALAADIPCILFWNPATTHLTSEAQALAEGLRAVGMVYETPEAAAAQVQAVWENVPAWWENTREAREAWSRQYAFTQSEPWLPVWQRALSTL